MPDLRWTTEPPTEAGEYLYRKRGTSTAQRLRVFCGVDGWAWVDDGFPHARGYEEHPNYEWLGPVPEPTDTPPTTGGEGKNR